MKNPPSISGKWKIDFTSVTYGKQTIYNPEKITYEATVEQNGRFVKSTFLFNGNEVDLLGVWKFNCKSGWELYNVEKSTDEDTYILSPVCVKNNIVEKFDGIDYEHKINPTVAYFTGSRV